MLVIGVRHKLISMTKKVDGFLAPLGLNNDYGGNFKGGFPPLSGVRRGPPTQFAVSVTPPMRSGGHLRHSLAVKPEIVGVAGANMQNHAKSFIAGLMSARGIFEVLIVPHHNISCCS